MIMQLQYTWPEAKAIRFNADKVRRVAKRVLKQNLNHKIRVSISREHHPLDLHDWLKDNTFNQYKMYGVFDDRPDDKMYFVGLAFEFQDEFEAMYFKLRFC